MTLKKYSRGEILMSDDWTTKWQELVGEQSRAWEGILEAMQEISKILSGEGVPMEDQYDDLETAERGFELAKIKAKAFLRDWQAAVS
tara:strand:- start:162 stop:422 length:261 start_codon:yes stop_codon:yes gene_type:complete